MSSETIKVHVTQVQREYLEFLVNRRLNDLKMARGAAMVLGPSPAKTVPPPGAEEVELEAIKYELIQAGS